MKIPRVRHPWSVTPVQAVAIQRKLAARVVCRGRVPTPRLVAGADLAFSPDGKNCIAGVVVWDVLRREVVEQSVVRRSAQFPYVPGLLTFREAPALLAALRLLHCEPDVFMFDGQGYAHPRRCGLACHLGVLLDRPSVGCAKTILIGRCIPPAQQRGAVSELIQNGERVGLAVRTRDCVKPLYVSIGHRMSLSSAARVVLACCNGFRLPEPTRLADKLVRKERVNGPPPAATGRDKWDNGTEDYYASIPFQESRLMSTRATGPTRCFQPLPSLDTRRQRFWFLVRIPSSIRG